MYMEGQVSICKVGRDIKKNQVLWNEFEVPVEEERMSKLEKCMYISVSMSVHLICRYTYICIYIAMAYKYVPILSV